MSLSRAFTTRRLRSGSDLGDVAKTPHRSKSTNGAQSIRNKISAPVQLLHTTNMLSYNAPDIPRPARSNSTNSHTSASDTESHVTADSTPPTSPDIASSPQPNHLSCYFAAATAGGPPSTPCVPEDAEPPPAIPKRSPSHTKKNSQDALNRQRSGSRMSRDSDHSSYSRFGPILSRSPSNSTRASSVSHASSPALQKQISTPSAPPPPAPSTAMAQLLAKETMNPFGQDLPQVTELSEEYTTRHLDVIDEEQQYLDCRGLQKFSADEYLGAVQGLSSMFFSGRTPVPSATPLWI